MDMTPRLTYPGRRIDALRGTAAVERGPLVYCFEQVDQPGAASVEDLALTADGLSERQATLPGVGPTVVVEAAAVRLALSVSRSGLPYSPLPDDPPRIDDSPRMDDSPAPDDSPLPGDGGDEHVVAAVAIPYFQWDNRDGQAMRVWMPLSRPGQPAIRDHPAGSRAPLSTEEA